jgi:hypothetical protein
MTGVSGAEQRRRANRAEILLTASTLLKDMDIEPAMSRKLLKLAEQAHSGLIPQYASSTRITK